MASDLAYLKSASLRYRDHIVLERVDLSVKRGEVFGILGRIGAGKTRILRLIAGLEQPQEGEAGHSGSLSYIFQNDLLLPWLTVGENLRLCIRDPQKSARPLADWLVCRQLGVPAMEKLKPFELSGGMRKKVNFARGFINDDPLILMDEPFGALDPAQKREMQRSFLSSMGEKKTAVLVTHDVSEALLVCDRIAFLSTREKKLTGIVENPYRGRFEAADLMAEAGYRAIYQQATDFYESERS